MRTKFRGGFVLLVAMFALSAVAAASASASTGELVNKEGKVLVKKKFTGKAYETHFEAKENLLECKSGTVSGEWTSTKSGTETIVYTGCRDGGLGHMCKTAGSNIEEVKMPLTLSVLSNGTEPDDVEASFNGTFNYECSTLKQHIRGGYLTPVGSGRGLSATLLTTFEGQEGRQDITSYQNAKGEKVSVLAEMSSIYLPELFSVGSWAGSVETTLEEPGKFI